MDDQTALADDVAALLEGRRFVDVSDRRIVRITGADAVAWLHDLLTADVAGLRVGGSRRSLLLSPTGRVRADLQVLRRADDLVLVQERTQPDPIDELLAPYILSSQVSLEATTVDLTLLAVPDATTLPEEVHPFRPSCLGPGADLVAPASAVASLTKALSDAGCTQASAEAAEAWRIRRGIARMGADFDQRSLPAEAGLDQLIDTTKGCFLGQEAVARVRNLGHPPRVLRQVRGIGAAEPGAVILVDGVEVGSVTSATQTADEGWIGLARVGWSAATAHLTDKGGHPLVDVGTEG
jgi:folate-binding protein YgfZ